MQKSSVLAQGASGRPRIRTDTDARAALIMRVSSKDQEDGYSLDAQERFLTEAMARMGLVVGLPVFRLAETASKADERDAFNEALAAVEAAGIPNLVFEKVDRSTRNFHDAAKLERWVKDDGRRSVHFVKEGLRIHKESVPIEWMLFGFQVTAAKGQAETIRSEVLKGMREKLEQGWWPGRPMLGYVNVRGRAKKMVQAIDLERHHHVRHLFELMDTGNYSVRRALDQVTREGLRLPEGRKVTCSHAHMMLTNRFYIGEMHWGGKVYRGQYPLFIDRALFERVGKRLRRPSVVKYARYNWLFKALVQCDECGSTISWYKQKAHVYGDCKNRACPLTQTAREDRVDGELQVHLAGLRVPPAWAGWIRDQLVRDTDDQAAREHDRAGQVAALEQLMARVRNKQDRLYDDRLDERISVEVYDRKKKELDSEVAELESQIATKREDTSNPAAERLLFWDGSQTVADRYTKIEDADTRRTILREIFSNLRLRGNLLLTELKEEAKWLAEAVADYTRLNEGFEQQNNASPQGSALLRGQQCLVWYTRQDSNL